MIKECLFVLADLQPDDDGRGQLEFLGGGDDTLSDDVTAHDATKDVDHDGVHLKTEFKSKPIIAKKIFHDFS